MRFVSPHFPPTSLPRVIPGALIIQRTSSIRSDLNHTVTVLHDNYPYEPDPFEPQLQIKSVRFVAKGSLPAFIRPSPGLLPVLMIRKGRFFPGFPTLCPAGG